ncbi:MAG: Nramp family divalent metal transporter [bacterium]
MNSGFTRKLALILPGMLVAATGVGAGDLATASFTGSQVGVAVLWAVIVGGVFKYVLTEGLARWQLVTGETFLEGVNSRFGRWVIWCFLPYLFLWTFFVGSALVSASGATLHALMPVFDSAVTGKIIFGVFSSLTGLGLVSLGGFRLFERVMSVAIALMFVTVVATALLMWPDTSAILHGIFVPTIPEAKGAGLSWTVALMGGVGGTLTILCYGYWIRESGREGEKAIGLCRVDLSVGYAMTILFGMAMLIVGSSIEVEGSGAGLLIALAESLEQELGSTGRLLFLLGAFAAIFSSLLGVWQSVPYLFADIWYQSVDGGGADRPLTKTLPYKSYLLLISFVSLPGLLMSFKEVQKLYAIIGAAFMPLLAIALLLMNGNRRWLGNNANGLTTTLLLLATLIFFLFIALYKWIA